MNDGAATEKAIQNERYTNHMRMHEMLCDCSFVFVTSFECRRHGRIRPALPEFVQCQCSHISVTDQINLPPNIITHFYLLKYSIHSHAAV